MSVSAFDFNYHTAHASPKNIALSPFGYWPKTRRQRFFKSIQYKLSPRRILIMLFSR